MSKQPAAAVGAFPYPHRTLAEVDRDEAFMHERLRSLPSALQRITCDYCFLTLRTRQVRNCARSTCPAKAQLG